MQPPVVRRIKPEIMSPAGHWPQLHAAIEAGADSVYFGLKHFTARAKVGFTLAELPEAMRTLHRRGVRGFVTFNTLVFEHELAEAVRALTAIADAGADAIIVQDAGVLTLARQIAPDLELHASTQMSITSADGVRFAQDLGASRITLARELSLAEVRSIRESTDADLEIFVHGALCVAYSGQCFSSEAWGGRSANRGQCAQACRLPYEMVVDDAVRPLGDARYLLSPGDLMALHHVPEIVDMGIAALKIEGRYKDADYVALTTRAYRKAVDAAWAGVAREPSAAERIELEQVYSRGLAPHFITGTNHQTVVGGRAPRHRGVQMGRVLRAAGDSVLVETSQAHDVAPVKPGDGVVFDAADWRSPEEPEEGGRVYTVQPRGRGQVELGFERRALNAARIRPGDLLWRTHDPQTDRAAKPYLEASTPLRKQPVNIHAVAREGEPLRTRWQAGRVELELVADEPLRRAQNRGITIESLRAQFDRLGNTPYQLASLTAEIEGELFAPASMLNALRRTAVDRLQEAQGEAQPVRLYPLQLPHRTSAPPQRAAVPQLHLLVRTAEQLDGAIRARPASVTLDYLDLYGLRPSVERVKAAGIPVRVAAPRVLKPGEEKIADFLVRMETPILVRSTGLLVALADSGRELTGDFSLNAANSVTAELYLSRGLARITPTHDLNAAQVAALARDAGAGRIEAIAYGHMPVFHTEHCVFCRFLSTGTSYRDCGRPCETHRVALRDANGREHPVLADVGCRNTVFGAEAQQAATHLEEWLAAGIGHYRLEFAHETADEVARVAAAFADVFAGRKNAQQLAGELRRAAPQGTTEGSLFVPKDYLTLPILQ